MLAFASFEEDEHTWPSGQEARDAIYGWIVIAICYHSVVFLCAWGGCVGDLLRFGPRWFQISVHQRCIPSSSFSSSCSSSISSSNEKCRIARYFKCHKRKQQQQRVSHPCSLQRAFESLANEQCPLQRAFAKLIMPPPLPFHRRRRPQPMTDIEPLQDSSYDLTPESEQHQVDGPSHDSETITNTDVQNEQLLKLPTSTSPCLKESCTASLIGSSQSSPSDSFPIEKAKRKSKKSKRQNSSPIQTSLIDLVRMQRWSSILDRAYIYKSEAQYRDSDGLLPLHWACSGGPPVEVVERLLDVYPEASCVIAGDGSTALHFAAHYGASSAVVEALLKVHPQAITVQDKYGRSPLYHAVDKTSSVHVLCALIRADPAMITTPCLPTEPKKTFRHDSHPWEHRTPLYVAWATALSDHQTRVKKAGRQWEKAQLLLNAAYAHRDSQTVYRMLHAAVAFDMYLPKDVLLFAMELYPELLKEKEDVCGRLPISIAAASRHSSSQRSKEILLLLLQHFPQAASVSDSSGRSPLALALDSGKSWDSGVALLFEAAPDLLHRRDVTTRLPPALLSASSTLVIENKLSNTEPQFALRMDDKALEWHHHMTRLRQQEQHSKNLEQWSNLDTDVRHISTIFKLLQADPSVIKFD